jgi:hypothetical protein
MQVTITIPVNHLESAIAIRDRIRGLILVKGESASITTGGVAIKTDNPARVSLELMAEGFID